MTYFDRYKDGQFVEVWDELSTLGGTVRDPALLGDAMSVAQATMERVATNIDRLIERLKSHGYEFGVCPDGTCLSVSSSARAKPDAGSRAHMAELERSTGTIPLSLKAFWDIVGSISLIGRVRAGWPPYGDPLCVEAPMTGLAYLRDFHADREVSGRRSQEPFLCPIAPDVLHKDNVSGGSPYSVKLPDAGADAMICEEWHNVRMVPYLRIAILDWGGFPGLSQTNPHHQWRSQGAAFVSPTWWTELTQDLIAF